MYKIKDSCPGCDMCMQVCPVNAISITSDRKLISNECIECGCCEKVCPLGLITKVDIQEDETKASKTQRVKEVLGNDTGA